VISKLEEESSIKCHVAYEAGETTVCDIRNKLKIINYASNSVSTCGFPNEMQLSTCKERGKANGSARKKEDNEVWNNMR
jgi:hypothetical protein